MTQSETQAAAGLSECPRWCATDHESWKHTHESEHTPISDGTMLAAAYAVGGARRGSEDHRVSVYGRDLSAGPRDVMSLNFGDPKEARAFAGLLELLAERPERLVQLAAQVRAAAAAVSGERA